MQANVELSYTKLTAPFAGALAKRLVEQFETIEAKQPVVELRDSTSLEMRFDVPEALLIRLREAEEGAGRTDVRAIASFKNAPGKEYALELKEFSTRADEDTQTFEVIYRLTSPDDLLVLSGMSGTVNLDLTRLLAEDDRRLVPDGAIMNRADDNGELWVVDEENMAVSQRKVSLGEGSEQGVQVTEGVEPGDCIVVAGVNSLPPGMKIRLMPDLEQAKARQGDIVFAEDSIQSEAK